MANHRGERRERRRSPEPEAVGPGSHRGSHAKTSHRSVPAADGRKPAHPRHAAADKASKPGARRATASPARKPTPPGARKASRAGVRKNLVPALPSVPTLAGAAVIALAATGALVLGHTPLAAAVGQGGITRLSASADLGRVAGAPSTTGSQRPSRDAQRPVVPDAQDPQLVAAADAQAQQRSAALDALAASAQRHADSLVWHLPVARGSYQLTARFGEVSGLWAHVHTGLDFAGPIGTPIMAVSGGVITSTGWAGAYGNRTVETLPDGTELWYCHQNAFNVAVGQRVAPGQVIGFVGATGNVTGPHLHLEVRPHGGDPVDPYTALIDHGVHP